MALLGALLGALLLTETGGIVVKDATGNSGLFGASKNYPSYRFCIRVFFGFMMAEYHCFFGHATLPFAPSKTAPPVVAQRRQLAQMNPSLI